MYVLVSLCTNFGIINIYVSGAFGDLARARRMGEIVELLLKKPGYSVRLSSLDSARCVFVTLCLRLSPHF